ncbi:MAG: oligosaccharide flippase family protein [Bacteroidales bacterium]|nr:oligosaccharide flippase family protein [Bacteroidales bacterium]
MQKKLLSGLFWVLLANLIVKPLWIFGIEVGVQNAVGNATYGFYFAVFNLAYIFNILLDVGITNYNTRNIAQHPQLVGKYLGGILTAKIALLGLYLLVAFSAGMALGYSSEEFHLLAWLCLAQFLNSLILYLRSNLEGLLLFKWDSLFSVLDRLLMIAICGCMLWTPLRVHFNIRWFVYAQVAAYALTALTALWVIARRTGRLRLRWNGLFTWAILKESAPFALLVLLMASYNRIDPILLRHLAGAAEAGIYAGAFRLLDALTMVAYLVSVPLLPVFSRICSQKGNEAQRQELSGSISLVFWPMMVFAVGVSVAGAIWAEPLMELLYHGSGAAYVPVFRVVVFGIIPICITYIFGTLLTADGKLRLLNLLAATSLLLNVVINLLLIPRLGAAGSAWASLSAQSFMAIGQMLLAIRLLHLPPSAFGLPRIKRYLRGQ